MAQNFLVCDREQAYLMPPSVGEWLMEGHLAWFVLDALERVDLSGIYGDYRLDGSGRAAHDPGMMVALLVYAYCVGERSSRRIERRCVEDVAFRVIAANHVPDHTTIARFRCRHAEALAELFVSVLALCAQAGMVKVGTVAVDGTKLCADAGMGANRCHPAIAQEVERILAEAATVDAAEDVQFGEARGDELPPELADPVSRRARLERAAVELEAEEAARRAAELAAYEAKSAVRENHKQATGSYPPGRPPQAPDPGKSTARLEKAKRNITDPDSRIMNARGAHMQAYNAQAAVGEGRVILAAEITSSPNDSAQLSRMLTQTRENLDEIGHPDKIKCLLADGGYWNTEQITEAHQSATVVIVPTSSPLNQEREQGPRGGPQADRINKILATQPGQRLYRQRASIVEPVFAHIKHTRGITRLHRRGLRAAEHEWKLIAATHNLLKLFRYQPQAA
jgi:transposase